jgi:hypothetical protein
LQGLQRSLQQGALLEQVFAAVGRQAQFGEGHQRRATGGGLFGQGDGALGVEAGSATLQSGTATATRAKPWL